MRIGVCGGQGKWAAIAEAGYDYVEPGLSWIDSLSDREFEDARKLLSGIGLKAETYNSFLGSGQNFYDMPKDRLKDYCHKNFARCAELGGEIYVIGSGKARSVPYGMTKVEAEERFGELLIMIGDVAREYGGRVVVEPLNYGETTLINTVSESVALCRKVNHPSVGTLVDFYHAYVNKETLHGLPEAKSFLWHTHLARPNPDRNAPTPADINAVRPYAEALADIGYSGRMSLECVWRPDFRTAIFSAKPIMELFKNRK